MNQRHQQTGGRTQTALFLWVFASVRGRISRQVYWLAFFAIYLIALAIMLQAFPAGLDPESVFTKGNLPGSIELVSMVSMVFHVIIGIKRLHDFNASGLFAIFFVIPVINFFAAILIGLIPGSPGPNRFGEHADRIPPP